MSCTSGNGHLRAIWTNRPAGKKYKLWKNFEKQLQETGTQQKAGRFWKGVNTWSKKMAE